MFKTRVLSTAFTSRTADGCFRNIIGNSYLDDVSFLATLRALLAPRMKEEDNVLLVFGRSSYNTSAINSVPKERAVAAICDGYSIASSRGKLVIHSLDSDFDSNQRCMEILRESFCTVYEGFHRLDKVTAFYQKSFAVDCYINPDTKSVCVFVNRMDIRKMHYLQVSILAFMPWYLNQEDGLTPDEFALIQSLRETSSDNYERCLAKLAEKYDFRTAAIREKLSGFENRYERINIDRMKEKVSNIDDEIERYNEAIGKMIRERNENLIKILGLEQKIAEGSAEDSEIMEYFLCNQKLVLEDTSDSILYFTVRDYLEYFDRDMAERMISNPNSYVYRSNDRPRRGIPTDKMEHLMMEIFVSETPRLRIRFCAAYSINITGGVSTNGHHEFGSECYGYLPNPHINEYNCMGDYVRTINNMIRDGNYIGAIEQCVASCKSLNFGDSIVMSKFMGYMWASEPERFIELPDGTMVSPREAIKWLEEQDGETKEETADEQTD